MSQRWLPVGIFALLILGIGLFKLPAGAQDQNPFEANAEPAPKVAEPKKPSAFQLSESNAPTEAELRKALNTPVKVDFRDDPLADVMKILAKDTGTNISLDVQALTEEGVAIDEGVTMKGKPIAAARLLDRILPPLGLTWVIEDHIVQVTTIIAADEKLFTVHYPVGELLEYAKEHQNNDLAATGEAPLEYVQFGGCGGIGKYGSAPGDWLIDLLQQMTPGPWVDTDGTGGSLDVLNNSLVVRQTQKNQLLIAKIISTVREFTKGPLRPTSVAIRPPHYAVDEDEAVNKALAKVISVKCKDLPLKDFAEDLGDQLGIPVHIDEQGLTEEGVAVDEPINLDLKNLPARSLLKVCLEPLGLTGIVEDGRVVITTLIAAEEILFTTIHDTRDLVDEKYMGTGLIDLLQNETSGPWIDVDGTGGEIEEPLVGMLVFRQTERVHNEVAAILADLRKEIAASPTKAEKKEPADPQAVSTKFYPLNANSDWPAIQQAIITLVEPKTWSKNGGEGEIVLINNQLVVKTKNEIQTQVQDFLKELEKANNTIQGPLFGGGSFGGVQGGGGTGIQGGGLGSGGGQGGAGFFQLPPGNPNSI